MLLHSIELPGIRKVGSGKVREIFDLGEHLLLVTTDRISAFDCILPNPIPRKGEVLTQLSAFWFRQFDFLENHVVSTECSDFPTALQPFARELKGRAMLVKKAQPLPVECVVRGYLAGSGLTEYQATRAICGNGLPPGLVDGSKLPKPLFTPATKAPMGEHDVNITYDETIVLVGQNEAQDLKRLSLDVYRRASSVAEERGLILADTKFEFGIATSGRHRGLMVLGDEVLTPDSSRYWPADEWSPGGPQPSFDKQYVRDWLTSPASGWDRDSGEPPPPLPDDVVERTRAKYLEAYERLTGERFA